MTMTVDIFKGEWQEYKSDNLDKLLDEAGIDAIRKAIASKAHPTQTFSIDGDTIHIKISMGPKTKETSFKLGEQIVTDTELLEGTAVTSFDSSTGTMRAVVTPKNPKKNSLTIERNIVDGELVQVINMGDVKCTRYFKKK